MRKLAEQGMEMLHTLGCAMYSRPDIEQEEARRYFKRILQLICVSGRRENDPAVYAMTPEGKQLSEAAGIYIRLMNERPDPETLDPESCIKELKAWYGLVILTAAGKQQDWEMASAAGTQQGKEAY